MMNKRYIKYLIFTILFFSVFNIVYHIAVIDNPNFSIYDFGINMLSELAGMIFTVVVFNEFITYRQQLSNSNKIRLLMNELEELMKCMEFPFQAAAKKYVDDICRGDLWNEKAINMIRDKLILSDRDDCVFPVLPWYMIFSMQGEKILHKCENIRMQYQDILEPQISDYLFYLLNNSEMLKDLSDIKKIYENDLLLNYTRPSNLGSYFACPTKQDFEVIDKLNQWIYANKESSKKETMFGKKYNKVISIALPIIFAIGAVGYCTNGNLFMASFLIIITILYLIGVYNRQAH